MEESDTNPIQNSGAQELAGQPSVVAKEKNVGKIALVVFIAMALIVVVCFFLFLAPFGPFYSDGVEEKPEIVERPVEETGLEKMASALCEGKNETIYKIDDDSGLFLCDETKNIYSITDPHMDSSGTIPAHAAYIGSIYNEEVEKYFKDTIYIYRDYTSPEKKVDLILLVEADSEQDLVEKIYESMFEFAQSREDIVSATVFYNESLDTVKTVRDYVMISAAIGVYNELPFRKTIDGYFFAFDDTMPALSKIGANPDLYSSETRNAIKFNRHITINLGMSEDVRGEDLKVRMLNSFEDL